jgi:hypothetical protein
MDCIHIYQVLRVNKLQFLVIHIIILCITFLSNRCLSQDWLQWGGPNGDFTLIRSRQKTYPSFRFV